MKVRLIKRNKIVHIGFEARVDGEVNIYSICNKRWYCDDKVSTGEDSEVTCKRCQKRLSKVNNDGYVTL